MTVTRKIFVAIASFVVSLAVIFVLLTQLVIQESFEAMAGKTRGEVLDALSAQLVQGYGQSGGSWEGVERSVPDDAEWRSYPEASIVVQSRDREQVYAQGAAVPRMVKNLGLKRDLRWEGRKIGELYYYDAEIADMSKLRIGIPTSVALLLSFFAVLFVLISLLAAYWVARRITAPLRKLIPAIDGLGRGELGIQAPVLSKDEYGKVALAFNAMSDRLRRNEETRRNLVADAAHELRTPLTIVRGKLDGLQQAGEHVDPKSLLPLQDEMIRLSRLVDDLQLLSLAEAGKLPLERKPTNMANLVRRVMDHVEPDAEGKNIALSLESEADGKPIAVDPNRMTQVMLNLLVNAIRYTPPGGAVKATIRELPAQSGEEAKLRIEVADTGVGMSPEQLEKVFDRFYRTDEARSRAGGGAGLGLAIAKELVLSHGGTLKADSELGRGSVFAVELPYDLQ